MPDRIDDPRNPFDRIRNRVVVIAGGVVVFVILPLALWWAGR